MSSDTPFVARITSTLLLRYSLALFITAAALLVGGVLGFIVSTHAPFAAAFLAVVVVGLYCGVGPSIMVALLSLAALRYWFVSPVHTLTELTGRQAIGAAVFLAASAGVIFIVESHRRANESLLKAQRTLEEQVSERTSELAAANKSLRDLSGRLMRLQDDERRRLARELHDSVGQLCAALAMNLTNVKVDLDRLAQTFKTISDSAVLVEEMHKEVRTISYLLHPPLLDEAGLTSALRWYIEGFSERSKIRVELDVPEDLGRFPQELETAVFRTVQECLTNIHRHSGSDVAKIRLAHSDGKIQLLVEDQGSGIPVERLDEVVSGGVPGVGIRGMRERLRQLHGDLQVQSDGKGTRVAAHLPIKNPAHVAA